MSSREISLIPNQINFRLKFVIKKFHVSNYDVKFIYLSLSLSLSLSL